MGIDVETMCRAALALMLVGIAMVGLPHRVRAERAGGKAPGRTDPPWFWSSMTVVGLPVAAVCLGFLVNPRWVDFAMVGGPPWVRLGGVPLGAVGVGLFAWVFRHLGLNLTSTSTPRTTATLVTTGPYHWVRHPMYSTALVLLAGTVLLTANWVVAVGGVLAFALLAARSRIEEERLVAKFGDEYRAYQRRTGRFVPRVRL